MYPTCGIKEKANFLLVMIENTTQEMIFRTNSYFIALHQVPLILEHLEQLLK